MFKIGWNCNITGHLPPKKRRDVASTASTSGSRDCETTLGRDCCQGKTRWHAGFMFVLIHPPSAAKVLARP